MLALLGIILLSIGIIFIGALSAVALMILGGIVNWSRGVEHIVNDLGIHAQLFQYNSILVFLSILLFIFIGFVLLVGILKSTEGFICLLFGLMLIAFLFMTLPFPLIYGEKYYDSQKLGVTLSPSVMVIKIPETNVQIPEEVQEIKVEDIRSSIEIANDLSDNLPINDLTSK